MAVAPIDIPKVKFYIRLPRSSFSGYKRTQMKRSHLVMYTATAAVQSATGGLKIPTTRIDVLR